MGGRRSDRGDRSSGRENEASRRSTSDSPSPGAEPEPFEWWDWREHTRDLDASVRPLAVALARRVEGREDPEELTRTVADSQASLPESWEAVSCLHRSLDRCHGSAPRDELSQARKRLDDACEELWMSGGEASVSAVRDFVREVAHDLRSPLHSIIFLTDALFREESGPLSPTQKRQISVVHSAAAALLRMANDLLDLSGPRDASAAGEVAEIPFSPTQVVDELENLLEPVTHHHKARLGTEIACAEPRVGDPQVLNRVLLNLACNALEAVEEEGTVRIRMSGDEHSLRAAVEDDAGDADLEEIRELVGADSYSEVVRRLGGPSRGLGLAICGRIVRTAGGALAVERTDDGWTRITVTLPFPELDDESSRDRSGGPSARL